MYCASERIGPAASLVPRPSYFAGVENEGLVHRSGSCMHDILTTMMSHSFMMNSTDIGSSMDGFNCTHCCIASIELLLVVIIAGRRTTMSNVIA